MKILKFLLVLCVVVFSAKTAKTDKPVENEEVAGPILQTILMSAYMNETVDPCDDFYQYACGNFEDVNPRLGGQDASGIARGMGTEIERILINIFESDREADNEVESKVKRFYKTCVNNDLFNFKKSDKVVELINTWGGFPAVNPDWSETESDWWKLNAELVALNINGLVGDNEEHDQPAIRLLSFRILHIHDFKKKYTKNNIINIALMKKLMILYGATTEQADAAVDGVLKFGEFYQMKIAEYYSSISLDDTQTICIIEEIICKLMDIVYDYKNREPFNFSWDISIRKVWKFVNEYSDKKSVYNYLILKALLEFHPELTKPKYIKPFCADQVKKNFPLATSLMFLNSEIYNKNVEREVLTMAENIRKEFIESIKTRDWIDEATKQRAINKIEEITIHIGSPFPMLKSWDFIASVYNNVTLTPDYFSNVLSVKRNYRIILNNVDRNIWKNFFIFLHDSMQAAYSFSVNSIIFTAGALIPPLYFTEMPKSYNYAAIGTTIAHEFTHALDGKNAEHQLNWEPQSLNNFKQRLSCIEDYFNNFVMEDIYTKVDGTVTRGENVADSGGIRHAYYAFQKNRDIDNVELKNDILSYLGLTENQFFFLSTAQLWCHSFNRKTALRFKDDVHTHDKYRVIGTLAHFEEFANAFNCPVGSRMNVEKKCKIW